MSEEFEEKVRRMRGQFEERMAQLDETHQQQLAAERAAAEVRRNESIMTAVQAAATTAAQREAERIAKIEEEIREELDRAALESKRAQQEALEEAESRHREELTEM
jgi:hypothetical protein